MLDELSGQTADVPELQMPDMISHVVERDGQLVEHGDLPTAAPAARVQLVLDDDGDGVLAHGVGRSAYRPLLSRLASGKVARGYAPLGADDGEHVSRLLARASKVGPILSGQVQEDPHPQLDGELELRRAGLGQLGPGTEGALASGLELGSPGALLLGLVGPLSGQLVLVLPLRGLCPQLVLVSPHETRGVHGRREDRLVDLGRLPPTGRARAALAAVGAAKGRKVLGRERIGRPVAMRQRRRGPGARGGRPRDDLCPRRCCRWLGLVVGGDAASARREGALGRSTLGERGPPLRLGASSLGPASAPTVGSALGRRRGRDCHRRRHGQTYPDAVELVLDRLARLSNDREWWLLLGHRGQGRGPAAAPGFGLVCT